MTSRSAAGQDARGQHADDSAIQGVVRDRAGKPVAGASVRLEQTGNKPVVTMTAADGSFALSARGAGGFSLSAEKSGLRSRAITIPAALAGAERQRLELVLDDDAAANGNGAPSPQSQQMEFADQPTFTVAGVTDWTAVGGHGSDTSLRISESLARETLALKPQSGQPVSVENSADLKQARQRIEQMLAHENTADLHRQLGVLDEKSGDPLGAVHEEELAVRLDPSEENYFAWGSELLLHRAVWQAAEVFAKGSRVYPQSGRLLTALGTALFASARYDEAALRLCQASDLDPANAAPYEFMGKIEMAAPSPLPCVEEKLARYAQQQPQSALANYYYAMAIWKRCEASGEGDRQAGVEKQAMLQVETLLAQAVKLDPRCAEASLQLGLLYSSQHEYPRAIEQYERAIAADPQLGEAHYRLAVAYDRIGEAAKGQREFQLHDEIEKSQADAMESQRREVKQFLVVLQGQTASPVAR